jgi:hypothetical protein
MDWQVIGLIVVRIEEVIQFIRVFFTVPAYLHFLTADLSRW